MDILRIKYQNQQVLWTKAAKHFKHSYTVKLYYFNAHLPRLITNNSCEGKVLSCNKIFELLYT